MPESCFNKSLEMEGVGNAGRTARPQPCVQSRKHTSVVTTVTPDSPDIPAREWF